MYVERYQTCGSEDCEEWLQKNGVDNDAQLPRGACERCRIEGPVSWDNPKAESLEVEVVCGADPEMDYLKISNRAIERIVSETCDLADDSPQLESMGEKLSKEDSLSASELKEIGDYFRDEDQSCDNESLAIHWYAKAARKGESWAMWRVGSEYWENVAMGDMGCDYKIAFACFRQAAELGGSEGMAWVGLCYQRGYGVPVNIPVAVSWFTQAAKLGNTFAACHLKEIEEKGLSS